VARSSAGAQGVGAAAVLAEPDGELLDELGAPDGELLVELSGVAARDVPAPGVPDALGVLVPAALGVADRLGVPDALGVPDGVGAANGVGEPAGPLGSAAGAAVPGSEPWAPVVTSTIPSTRASAAAAITTNRRDQ
jgi:hypothetical protein